MISPRLFCVLALALVASGDSKGTESHPAAAALAADLEQISLDATRTFHVRDLELVRGDIKLYLNEGILSFLTPVDGRVVAAYFTTEGTDAGDAEVILLPPQASERASLASFTKSPNLDEHFGSALFLFSDDTVREVLSHLNQGPVREAPNAEPSDKTVAIARKIVAKFAFPLIGSLLNHHSVQDGFFYATIAGRSLGGFDVSYEPTEAESISAGRPTGDAFQLWTNFAARGVRQPLVRLPRISNYRVDINIQSDLSLEAVASFDVKANTSDGRVLLFSLSPHLKVVTATINGQPVEIFQRSSDRTSAFYLVPPAPLSPGTDERIEVHYSGAIIRRTKNGGYFVDDRNGWYPAIEPLLANFDLTFHCPERLQLVSTGELLDESVADGIRTVHRRTMTPAALAGFNVGEYTRRIDRQEPYSIEVDSPATALASMTADPTLPAQTDRILGMYTKRWIPLPIRSVAISPIEGYFGQGFPGLIYLSSIAYIKEQNRSAALRGPRSDAFFSDLLLPHEIAHQWWGNIVRQSDYRSAWLTEAMANQSALEYLEHVKGVALRDEILESFRHDLTVEKDGKTIASAGPVDFGERLINTHGLSTWQIIVYEKGCWVLHMLRQRLGDANYQKMQIRMLQDYSTLPISNDQFRQLASAFVPQGQPDRSLTAFFETWVYGTGVPTLALRNSGRVADLELSGVNDDFIADIPLRCGSHVQWVHAASGTNPVNLPARASSCELPSPRDFLYLSPH